MAITAKYIIFIQTQQDSATQKEVDMNIEINASGYNAEPLRHSHIITSTAIGLYVQGLKHSVEKFPDGKIRTQDVSARVPSLRLYFPGGISEYEYDSIRENWWISLGDNPPVYYDFALKRPVFKIGNNKIPIKSEIPLAPAEIPAIRMTFAEIHAGIISKTDLGKATAELLLGGLLAKFLKEEFHYTSPSIAERYKQLIDADIQWKYSLEELSDQLSSRRDITRDQFVEEFGMMPGKYRIQRRLGYIMDLITSSDLSAKEIAWQCGLKNVTYLNSLTKKHFNATPSELIHRFRRVVK